MALSQRARDQTKTLSLRVQAGLLFDLPYRACKKSPGALFYSFSTKEIKKFILKMAVEARSVALRWDTPGTENQKRDQQQP
ncbi:unnamed protein product [Lasius platythorax]|uniref:Uncharacterized protein n=1 Tax=Lasius platythorax TaxID=488582 RepID=A0AAV2P233_9HYME